MRRRAPRPIGEALKGFATGARPRTLLARVQGVWEEAAGPTVAAEAAPRSEAAGVITVDCSSAVWAQELDLLGADLLERVNGALGGAEGTPVKGLRFRIARPR